MFGAFASGFSSLMRWSIPECAAVFCGAQKTAEEKILKLYLGRVCGFGLESQDFASTAYT